MANDIKEKALFKDDNIEEEELGKLEAEIEKTDTPEDDVTSDDPEKTAGEKTDAVELDKADFFHIPKSKEKGKADADSSDKGAKQSTSLITRWILNKKINIIGAFIMAPLIIAFFMLYILMGKSVETNKGEVKQAAPEVPANYGSIRGKIGPKVVLPDPPLALAPLIIPIEKGTDDAYLFLSISVMSPNSKVYEEIKSNDASLRDDLYNHLNEIVNGGKVKIAPRKEIKREILRSLNKRLDSGKIEKVYFTDFLLV